MVDFIKSETKKMMYKCCDRYATSNRKSIDDIQLVLGLNVKKLADGESEIEIVNENELNTYNMCESFAPKKSLTIMEVLNVKIDFLGYSKLAPPFIFKALVRLADQYGIAYDKVGIMCVPTKNEKNKPDILLALYNGNSYVETYHTINEGEKNEEKLAGLSFSDLFREEDMEMPTT